MSIRTSLARVSLSVHEFASRDRWYKDPIERNGHARRGGVQFTTTGALEAFCESAFGLSPGGRIEARAGGHRLSGELEDVVSQLAQLPAATRRSIALVPATDPVDAGRVRVRFANGSIHDSEVRITGYLTDQDFVEVKNAVDVHTTPLTWSKRRRGEPVLLPMTAKEEHLEGLKRALNRRSSVFGALAGLGTSLLVLLGQRIIGGT